MTTTGQRGACPGRQREFRSLLARLQSGLDGTPGSALVIGAPGFGKSAFLAQLFTVEDRRTVLGPLADKLYYCPLRVPPDDGLDEHSFLAMMRSSLDGKVVEEQGGRCSEAELEDALQKRIEQRGLAHVFLVDDFHRISRTRAFSMPFFSFLRYLGYNLRAGFVLTSQLDISEMAIRSEVQASPFWNIFSKIRMGPLSDEQSRALLTSELSSLPGVGATHAEALAPLAGGIPFLLDTVTSAARRVMAGGEEWTGRNLLEHTLRQAEPGFEHIWRALKEPWQKALPGVVERGRSPTVAERDALLPVADLGYLDGDTFEVRSLAMLWDWSRRLRYDPEPLVARLPELPPPKKNIIRRLLRV